ncbi:MAG TPA: MerR family transcriptional regulator [Acidimicrobiales bacterium]|nr:MerR family transcriptional regulator [Acidimicrobiales bacterium]
MSAPTTANSSPSPLRADPRHERRALDGSLPTDRGHSAGPRDGESAGAGEDGGLRIGKVAARAGVSTRTLRYYEELGLLEPSGRTAGGERRYQTQDLAQLERIIELKDLLGMNLEAIRELLTSRARLDELRVAYKSHEDAPATTGDTVRRAILEEALALQGSLIERMDSKLARLAAYRAEIRASAEHCAALLQQLE